MCISDLIAFLMMPVKAISFMTKGSIPNGHWQHSKVIENQLFTSCHSMRYINDIDSVKSKFRVQINPKTHIMI